MHKVAVAKAKDMLAKATLLVHPSPSAPTSIVTDASSIAVGAVLQQLQNGVWSPLAFFSKRLSPAETRYAAFDRELLAVFLAVRKFRWFLEGRKFTVFSDHKPLVDAMAKTGGSRSPRQERHLSYISEFTTDVRHLAGGKNVVADALSRVECDDPEDPVEPGRRSGR